MNDLKVSDGVRVPDAFFEDYISRLSIFEMRIYLLLCACNSPVDNKTIKDIALKISMLEMDIYKVLEALKNLGLISFNGDGPDKMIVSVLKSPVLNVNKPDNQNLLLDGAEKIKGSPLSVPEMQLIFYLHDALGFNNELLFFLLDYSKGHFNVNYIKTVAFSWHERGIKTVDKARLETFGKRPSNLFNNYPQNVINFEELEAKLLDN